MSALLLSDLAARWGTTPNALHLRIARGQPMPRGWRNGKAWTFPEREVERFEEKQMAEAERVTARRAAPIRRSSSRQSAPRSARAGSQSS